MGAKASSLASLNDTAPALRVRDLRKTYDNGTQALKGVSLEVAPGDFFALLGPNGAGKSPLIGIISSLVNLSEGQVEVFGSDLVRNRSATMRLIGLVPQEINFNLFEKPFDILVNYAGFYGVARAEAEKMAEEELKRAHLWEKAQVMSRTLSGGMKRRLMIARALMHRPKILFLDEPTVGLDADVRRRLWGLIKTIQGSGTTIFLTTHYIEEAEYLADRVAFLDKGTLRALDTPAALKARIGEWAIDHHEQNGMRTDYFPDHAAAQQAAQQSTHSCTDAMTLRRVNLEDAFLRMTGKESLPC